MTLLDEGEHAGVELALLPELDRTHAVGLRGGELAQAGEREAARPEIARVVGLDGTVGWVCAVAEEPICTFTHFAVVQRGTGCRIYRDRLAEVGDALREPVFLVVEPCTRQV